jgi:hypothetical protein
MNNKKRSGLGLSILLVVILVGYYFLPGTIFSDGKTAKDIITKKWPKPSLPPGVDTTHEEPKQEIKPVLEYKWNAPLDSCHGRETYFWQITFDPLPEINKLSKVSVKLKSCTELKESPQGIHLIYKEGPLFTVQSDEDILDFTQLNEPRWFYPIEKGEIYKGYFTIAPRDVGRYQIRILGWWLEICFMFGFNENGELVHLSDRGSFPISDLPNYPLITDKEIYVKFNGQYVTNLFHITPPLFLNDTSTVYYRVITKDYYPDGMKIVTRDGKINYKMLPGPITKGDTLEGSFKVVPSRPGANGFALDIEEPPREGVKPKNDRFIARYHLDKDGKLLYIVKTQKESKIFYEYFKKQGVTVGEY